MIIMCLVILSMSFQVEMINPAAVSISKIKKHNYLLIYCLESLQFLLKIKDLVSA